LSRKILKQSKYACMIKIILLKVLIAALSGSLILYLL